MAIVSAGQILRDRQSDRLARIPLVVAERQARVHLQAKKVSVSRGHQVDPGHREPEACRQLHPA